MKERIGKKKRKFILAHDDNSSEVRILDEGGAKLKDNIESNINLRNINR